MENSEMETKKQISSRQFQRMLMIELFSTTSLILPSLIVRFSGKNGLTPLLLGSGFALVLAVYYLWICEDWKWGYEKEMMNRTGKVAGSLYMILYAIRYFLHSFFLMVLFSALIQEVLLPQQKRGLILLPLFVLVFYGTRKTLLARARTLELLFPYIFVPLLLVLILALFQVDYASLPDMLWNGRETETKTVLASYGILLTYQAMEFLLFLSPVTKQKNKKEIGMGRVCFLVIFLNVLIYVVTVGMFGTIRTGEKLWSALYIMQNVRLPGHFLERLDILFLAFWIFSIFALFSGYLFYSESIVKEWKIKMQEEKEKKGQWSLSYGTGKCPWYPILFLLGVFGLVCWQPEPEKILTLFCGYLMWIDFPLSVLLPLFLKRRKKAGMVGLFLILCLFSFTGCQSRIDIEDRNYIMTLGLEKGKEEELTVTYGQAGVDKPAGQKSGEEQQGTISSYEAENLAEAEKKDSRRDEKKLDYGHLKAILFSKDLIADEKLWKDVKKELEKKSNLAGTVLVFQVEGSAKECIEIEESLGIPAGEYLDQMMTNHKKRVGEEYTLGELLRDEAEGKRRKSFPTLKVENKKMVLLP